MTHFKENKSLSRTWRADYTFLALCGRRYVLLRNRWGRGELRPRWRRLQTSTPTSTVTLDTHEATLPPRGASVHTAVRGNPELAFIVSHLAQPHRPVNGRGVRVGVARRLAFRRWPCGSCGGAASSETRGDGAAVTFA